jgi:hypothetical protein
MRVCSEEHVREVGRHLLSSGGVMGRDSSPLGALSAPLAASVPRVESYHVMLSRICKYLAPKLGKFLFQKALTSTDFVHWPGCFNYWMLSISGHPGIQALKVVLWEPEAKKSWKLLVNALFAKIIAESCPLSVFHKFVYFAMSHLYWISLSKDTLPN